MNNNIKAAGLMILATTLISGNDAAVKLLSESYGIGQVIFLRGLVACTLFAVVVMYKNKVIALASLRNRFVVNRAVFELLATFAFVTGLSLLPIATAATLVFTSPLFLTLAAALLLREHVGVFRWAAVITGFCGVLLITRPGDEQWSWVMLLPLIAACLVVGRDLSTHRIPANIPSELVALVSAMLVTLGGLVLALFSWQPLVARDLVLIVLSGIFICGAYLFYITAIRMGELSFVSPFTYTSIVIAIVLGMLIWNDKFELTMGLGAGLIIISGIIIFQRERRGRR